jgi:hypothetical protein
MAASYEKIQMQIKKIINKSGYAPTAAAHQYQNFGFHLVTKSPWPILMSFSLLNLAIGAVLSMHGFNYGGSVISLGLIITIFGMGLWFRDIVMEGTWRRATFNISLYFLCVVCVVEVLVVAQAYLYLTLILLTITNNNKECLYDLIKARALPDQEVKRALSIYQSRSKFKIWRVLDSNLSKNNKTVLQKKLLNINVMTKRNYSITSNSSKFITSNK